MKYIAPTIVTQHSALTTVLGVKGSNPHADSRNPTAMYTTAAGYESDE
jgi:hypothetical protein